MEFKRAILIDVTDQERAILINARDIMEMVATAGEQNAESIRFRGSNYNMNYDEIRQAAYLLTKIAGTGDII